jgi:hypothetical protein
LLACYPTTWKLRNKELRNSVLSQDIMRRTVLFWN